MSRHNKNKKVAKSELTTEGCVGLPYLRVSSKRQEIEGTGLQSQEKRCLLELQRMNIPHEKSFFDSFTGGGDYMKRPAMSALLKYIDDHPYKRFVVIFDDLKRFARDTEFHLKLRTAFRKRDVILKCLNYNFDDSPEGLFVETILSASNELEKEQNKRQVVQKMKARMENGYRAFPAVKGYTRTKDALHGKIDIQNEKAIFVKEALEGFASMRFVHKIDGARFLQEKGVISKKQSADKAITTFDTMLKEIYFAGYIEYEPWEVKRRIGHHKPLIDLEIWEKNQRRLSNFTGSFVRQDVRDDFELRGLINCATCFETKLTGAPTTSGTGDKHNYYKCPNKKCAMYGKSIKAKDLHDRFDELLKQIKPCTEVIDLATKIMQEVWSEEIGNRGKIRTSYSVQQKAMENEIDGLTSRISIAIENGTSEIVIRQYEKQLEKVAIKLEDLEQEISTEYDYAIPNRTATDEVLAVLKSPYSVWCNYNVHQKQRFFSFIFETNLVYDKFVGYRTPNYSLPIRVFEEISTSQPVQVELGGVEPPCKRCS
jgi:site-specific DNA recombinase